MFRQTAFGIALLGTLIFPGPVRWGVRYNRVDGQSVETIPFEKFHSRYFINIGGIEGEDMEELVVSVEGMACKVVLCKCREYRK